MFKFVATGLFLALAAQVGGETAEAKAARKAIGDVLQKQVAAWNKGDLLAFMDGYLKSDDLTFYSGGTVLKGWNATLERYQKKYQGEGKEMGKVAFKDLDIQILSADTAVVRGRWELKMINDTPGGLFTLIFRKAPEGWRIIHDHTSSN
jgi:beta-aspartyl-peptidase (threonine type)